MIEAIKKHLKYIVFTVFVLLVIGVLVYIVFLKKDDTPKARIDPLNTQLAKACDVLTPSLASAVLAAEAIKQEDPNAGQSVGEDIASSECVYVRKGDEAKSPEQQATLSLRIRSARNPAGEQANRSVFETLAPGADSVAGVGQKAYWSTEFGQLNVLSGKDWYIIEFGPGVPTLRKLEGTKEAASQLKL